MGTFDYRKAATIATDNGYSVRMGSYTGTNDNVYGTWYIDNDESNMLDRRGRGYRSKRAAYEAIIEQIANWEDN